MLMLMLLLLLQLLMCSVVVALAALATATATATTLLKEQQRAQNSELRRLIVLEHEPVEPLSRPEHPRTQASQPFPTSPSPRNSSRFSQPSSFYSNSLKRPCRGLR